MDSAPDGVYNKGMRPKNVRYPSGRLVHYRYGPEGSRDEMISRLATIHDDSDGLPGEVLSEYAYSGLGRMASERYPTPDVRLDYYQGTSPAAGQPSTASRQGYAGLDRYGRVKDQRWRYEGATPADLDRYAYGYDYGSNRLWRENMLTHGTANKFDEFYTYDGLSRLSNADRGTLDDPPWGGILAQVFRQKWGLDQMGNWDRFWQDNSDSGATWDIDQTRDHNAANEITAIGGTGGWFTPPVYDARGNMVTMPKSDSPTVAMQCVYDAWNRMVQAKQADNTVIVTYRYDGTGRRIRKLLGADPENPTATYDFYHNPAWQILETRKNGSANPLEQFVWSPRYVHSPVCRWYDSDTDGQNVVQHYYTNDANFNVTALIEPDGDVVERYTYDPYGKVTFRAPAWSPLEGNVSAYANDVLFTGHRLDVETGLYYTPFRYYHPTLGDWITRDGGYWDGPNVYQYVGSQPIQLLDPLGQKLCFTIKNTTNCKERKIWIVIHDYLAQGADLEVLTLNSLAGVDKERCCVKLDSAKTHSEQLVKALADAKEPAIVWLLMGGAEYSAYYDPKTKYLWLATEERYAEAMFRKKDSDIVDRGNRKFPADDKELAIVLAHEMIHAYYHQVEPRKDSEPIGEQHLFKMAPADATPGQYYVWGLGIHAETEYYTVGMEVAQRNDREKKFVVTNYGSAKGFTENQIREDFGYPWIRMSYGKYVDYSKLVQVAYPKYSVEKAPDKKR